MHHLVSNNLSLSPEHCFARNSLPGNPELADLKIFEQLLTQQNKHNRILLTSTIEYYIFFTPICQQIEVFDGLLTQQNNNIVYYNTNILLY